MKGTKLYRKIAALALVAIMACCTAASALGPLYSSYTSLPSKDGRNSVPGLTFTSTGANSQRKI